MSPKGMYFTRSEVASGVLAALGVPRSHRQIRTLEQHGIIRPAYVPAETGDSTLHGLEELALFYLDALMERDGIPYVRRALTIERVADVVRAAVRRPHAVAAKSVVVDRLGGRVLAAGDSPEGLVAFRVSVDALTRRVERAARQFRQGSDVWFGRRWTTPEDVAAQLAAV